MSISSVPGFDALGLNGDGTASVASQTPAASPQSPPGSSPAAATQNPYQQTYNQIESWSSSYLLQALEYGAPPIQQFTAGQSVDSFAQLTNTLAAIQPGITSGLYGGGTGTNVDATA